MKRLLIAFFLVSGCEASDPLLTEFERVQLEQMRWQDLPPEDSTNAVFESDEAWAFGKALFYDARLSSNGEFACATCHQPDLGFADGLVISEGLGKAARHAPSLLGSAYRSWFLWDGGCDTLWCQAIGPLENPSEMNFTRAELAHLIAEDEAYAEAYGEIFGAMPDLSDKERFPEAARPDWSDEDSAIHQAWVGMSAEDQQTINQILSNTTKAMGAFERSIQRTYSPFDAFADAVIERRAIGQALYDRDALAGFKLFVGAAGCVRCHSGPHFTNGGFYNSGVGDRDWLTEPDEGRIEGVLDVLENPFNAAGMYSDDPQGERAGRLVDLEPLPEQLGAFVVPTLRNVSLSPPYMHGGQHADLGEVLQHYSLLEEQPREGNTDAMLTPLLLSAEQIAQLEAFLESLTGMWIDPAILPPDDAVF